MAREIDPILRGKNPRRRGIASRSSMGIRFQDPFGLIGQLSIANGDRFQRFFRVTESPIEHGQEYHNLSSLSVASRLLARVPRPFLRVSNGTRVL